MIKGNGVPGILGDEIGDIASAVMDQYKRGILNDEREITGRLLGEIDEHLSDVVEVGNEEVHISTRPFKLPEENATGADLGIRWFAYGEDDYKSTNGVLIQAKRNGTDHDNLRFHCLKMLSRTPASYVLVYCDRKGAFAIPAATIFANDGTGGEFHDEYYFIGLRDFSKWFFKSFVGDPRLSYHLHQPSGILPLDDRPQYLLDIGASSYEFEVEQIWEDYRPTDYRYLDDNELR